MKACNTCPFIEGSQNTGSPDWLQDVLYLRMADKTGHTCHKTDSNACGYIGGEKRQCNGILMVEANEKARVKIHPLAYRDFRSFFKSHLDKWRMEGILK